MHAVIRTGGKQYRVAEGDILRVEKLQAEAGDKVELDEVLLISDGETVAVGNPLVTGGKVTAEVRSHGRGDKIEVIKFKRRKKYRRKQGHRQDYTELQVTAIAGGGKAKSTGKQAAAKKDEAKQAEPEKKAAKAAPKKETAKEAGESKSAAAATKKDTATAKKKPAAKKAEGGTKKSGAGTAKKKAAAKSASGTAAKSGAKTAKKSGSTSKKAKKDEDASE